jgi:hypothetical protein
MGSHLRLGSSSWERGLADARFVVWASRKACGECRSSASDFLARKRLTSFKRWRCTGRLHNASSPATLEPHRELLGHAGDGDWATGRLHAVSLGDDA